MKRRRLGHDAGPVERTDVTTKKTNSYCSSASSWLDQTVSYEPANVVEE